MLMRYPLSTHGSCLLAALMLIGTVASAAVLPLTVLGPDGGALAGNPATLAMRCAPGLARPAVLTIRNDGTTDLHGLTASLRYRSGTHFYSGSDLFSISHAPPSILPAGKSATLVVTYLPKEVTLTTQAELLLSSSDAGSSPLQVNLSGISFVNGPLLVVTGPSGAELGTVSGGSVNASPVVSPSGITTGQSLKLTNYGNADITDLAVTLPSSTGSISATFSGPNTVPKILPMGASTSLSLSTSNGGTSLYVYVSGMMSILGRGQGIQFDIQVGTPPLILNGNPPVLIGSGTLTVNGSPLTLYPMVITPTNPSGIPGVSAFLQWRLGEEDSSAAAGAGITDLKVSGYTSQSGTITVTAPMVSVGAPTYVSSAGSPAVAKVGSTLGGHFDGSSSVRRNIILSPSNNFALEAWVRPTTSTGTQAMVYQGAAGTNGCGFYQVDSTLRCRFGGVGDIAQTSFSPGEWVHLAVVRLAGTSTFYVNGIATGTPSTLAPLQPTAPLTIGGASDGADFFTGDVDEIRFSFLTPGFNPSLQLLVNQTNGLILSNTSAIVVSPMDLGSFFLGQTVTMPLTLTNSQPTPASAITATLDGANASDFIVSVEPASSLAPYAATPLTVRFYPTALGLRTATLHITSDTQTLDLVINGAANLPPEIAVENSTGSSFTSDQSSLGFAVSRPVQTLTVRNTGAGPLNRLVAMVDGTHAADFTASGLPATIAAGDSATLTITYHATRATWENATLRIASNDQDENPFIVPLFGSGLPQLTVEASLAVRQSSGREVLNFSRQRDQIITLRNTGSSTLSNLAVTVTGAQAGEFTVTPLGRTTLTTGNLFGASPVSRAAARPIALSSGSGDVFNLFDFSSSFSSSNLSVIGIYDPWLVTSSTTQITVHFNPAGSGIREGMLHITSNDPAQPSFDVALVGRDDVPMPEIEVQDQGTTLVNFDNISMGPTYEAGNGWGPQMITRKILIKNTGLGPLTGIVPQLVQTGTAFTTALGNNGSLFLGAGMAYLDPGGTLELTVTFNPASVGWHYATLKLHSSDTDESPIILFLNGLMDEQPKLGLRQSGQPFVQPGTLISSAATAVDKSSTITLEVVNQGSGSIRGLTAVVQGTEAAAFHVSRLSATSLARGARATFTVRFNPQAEGIREAKLRLSTDYVYGSDLVVSLAGYGTQAPVVELASQPLLIQVGDSITLNPFSSGTTPTASPPLNTGSTIITGAGSLNLGGTIGVPITTGASFGTSQPLHLPSESYQWLKNGKSIPGATSDSYQVSSASLASAGTYSIAVKNIAGTTVKEVVNCAVFEGIPSGAPSMAAVGKPFTMQAIAAGQGLAYQWFEDGLEITGLTAAKSTITPSSSGFHTYHCRIRLDTAEVGTDVVTVQVVNALPRLQDPGPQVWSIYQTVSLAMLANQPVAKFGMSGQPPGLRIDQATGEITGILTTAGNYRVIVWAENPAGRSTVVVPVTVKPIDSRLIGSYTGLISSHAKLNDSLGGMFHLNVTSAATYSGKLQLGTRTWSLAGKFIGIGTEGLFTTIELPFDTLSSPMQIEVSLVGQDGTTSNSLLGFNIRVPEIAAYRYSQAYKRIAPKPSDAGRYNMALEPTFLMQSPKSVATLPSGYGYVSMLLHTNGVVTMSGRLADGSAITVSTDWNELFTVPIYQLLYGGQGFFSCPLVMWPEFSVLNTETPATWFKKASPTSNDYPLGWSLTQDGTINRYVPPAPGKPMMDLPAGSPNARFVLTGGGESVPSNMPMTLTASSYRLLPDSTSPRDFWLSLNTATGLFNGGFKTYYFINIAVVGAPAIPPTTATFSGAILPFSNQGFGQFTRPKGPGGPNLSGNLTLEALPAR